MFRSTAVCVNAVGDVVFAAAPVQPQNHTSDADECKGSRVSALESSDEEETIKMSLCPRLVGR
jgi:hypothetical protein